MSSSESHDGPRLPGKVETLLKKWPDSERSAVDWEKQALGIMQKLPAVAPATPDIDVLAAPLPLLPDEGQIGGAAERADVTSLEALELSRSNHEGLRGSVGARRPPLSTLGSGPPEKWRSLLWGSAIALAAGVSIYFGVHGGGSREPGGAASPAVALAPAPTGNRLPPHAARLTFNGALLVHARACMSPEAAPVHATVTFSPDGKVSSVTLAESLGSGPDDCIKQALKPAEMSPFSDPSFTTTVVIDPQP